MTREYWASLPPVDQRIAIARICGYKDVYDRKNQGYIVGLHPNRTGWTEIPDYINDLNAMHEIEKLLEPWQVKTYRKLLSRSVGNIATIFRATADQRAEAFAITMEPETSTK